MLNAKIIVIKIGGATFGKHDPILEDIVTLQKKGINLVVIHGGGNLVTEWLKKQNIQTTFVRGERVTDRASLDVVTAVLCGLANKQIVGTLTALGGKAAGISGVDGGMVKAGINNKELGYVVVAQQVDASLINALLNGGFIPVISPVSYFGIDRPADGPVMLNINGDPLAGEIAAAVKASKLIFLTDIAGVMDKNGKLMEKISKSQAQELINSGVISGGMIPKITAAIRAAEAGAVTRIIDGRQPKALMDVIENDHTGTVIA